MTDTRTLALLSLAIADVLTAEGITDDCDFSSVLYGALCHMAGRDGKRIMSELRTMVATAYEQFGGENETERSD